MGAVILAPELVAEMTPDELADYESYLRSEHEALDASKATDNWRDSARPEQIPPDGDWWIWYLRGGRGAGKTWTGANALAELIQTNPPGEWAAIGPTYGDARDTCIESAESGLLTALGLPRSYDGWNRSMGELRLPSGSVVYADGADDGALRIQGKNLRGAWCVAGDEPVLTETGWRRIDGIRPGESVWTRHGWRLVTAAVLTRRNAPVVTLRTNDSHAIRLTSNHLVWTEESGWLRTDQLRPGMTVATAQWQGHPRTSNGQTSAGTGAPRPVTTQTAPAACSTSRSGSTSTSSGSQKAWSSTTSTRTPRTTTRRTLKRWNASSIYVNTVWPGVRTLISFASPSATRRGLRGQPASPVPSSARTAASPSTRLDNAPGSAPRIVESRSTVATVEPSGHADVYDLTVEGAHEFVAGGVVVHNCDEVGLWKRWKIAWDESLRFAVRKAPARIIATGTPKRGMPAITLVRRLLADETVVKSLLRTVDNAEHLHPAALDNLLRLAGTALGMQELEGAVLDEADGALWTRDEERAVTYGLGLIVHGEKPADNFLGRRVVAVDPSDGLEDGDEYGLSAATVGVDSKVYVLANDGVRLGPEGNIAATRRMYDAWSADVVVVEKNHGGAYLPQMLRDAGMPVQVVTASQGKRTRAEPVAALYAPAGRGSVQGVVHCSVFDELEDQMTSWTGAPGEASPDRMDSLVWALTALVDVDEDYTVYDDDLGYERVSIGPVI